MTLLLFNRGSGDPEMLSNSYKVTQPGHSRDKIWTQVWLILGYMLLKRTEIWLILKLYVSDHHTKHPL